MPAQVPERPPAKRCGSSMFTVLAGRLISVIPSAASVITVVEPSALVTSTLNFANSASAAVSLPSPFVSQIDRSASRSPAAVGFHSVKTYCRCSVIALRPSGS